MGRGGMLLVLAYPVTVHYGTLRGDPLPALLVLLALMAMLLSGLARTPRGRLLLLLLLAALSGAAAVLWPTPGDALLLPPVALALSLALLFGSTLRAGQRPLVTRIAEALGDPMDAALRRYTRGVTLAWTLFFAALAMTALALAFEPSRIYWSWFTNVVSYLLVLAFFVVEFALRRQRFPHLPRRSFAAFMRALLHLDLRALAR